MERREMMKIWMVGVLLIASSSAKKGRRTKFRSALSTQNQDLYVKLKTPQTSGAAHSRTESVEEKKSICAAIINHTNFPAYGHYGNLLNLHDAPVRDELRRNHPDFYEAHYREPASPVAWETCDSVNPYRPRNVTARKQQFEEFVFSCLSRNRGRKIVLGVLQYFISAAYDVDVGNDTDGGGAEKNVARFVFAYVGEQSLAFVTMAQEVAATPGVYSIAAENMDAYQL